MAGHLLGLLRVKVQRGVNLAVRDVRSSDPYVVLRLGKQKLKTKVMKKNLNPEWDEELILSVEDPSVPLKFEVYDHDLFSKDDSMGDTELDILPFVEAVKKNREGIRSGAMIKKLVPNRQNCLVDESPIYCEHGKVVQDAILRLRNVESGEIEVQLRWVDVPGARSL